MIEKQGRPSIGYSEALKREIMWEQIRNANHARLQVTRQSSLTEIVEHFLRAGRSIVGDQQLFHVPRVTPVGWHGLPRELLNIHRLLPAGIRARIGCRSIGRALPVYQ